MAIFRCLVRPWPTIAVGHRLLSFARGGVVDSREAAVRLNVTMEAVEGAVRALPAFGDGTIVEERPESHPPMNADEGDGGTAGEAKQPEVPPQMNADEGDGGTAGEAKQPELPPQMNADEGDGGTAGEAKQPEGTAAQDAPGEGERAEPVSEVMPEGERSAGAVQGTGTSEEWRSRGVEESEGKGATETEDGIACPVCAKVCRNLAGLKSHMAAKHPQVDG